MVGFAVGGALLLLVAVNLERAFFCRGAVVVLAAVVATGCEHSGIVDATDALFFLVTEYTSSKFFFFSSQTISDNKPSELLVVVLPASSRSADDPSLGKSSMLA